MKRSEPQSEPQQRLAELEQRLRARTFELEVLHELSSKIGSSVSYEELFHAILLHLGEAISYDVAASLLHTADQRGLLFLRRLRPLAEPVRAEITERMRTAYGLLGGACGQCEEIAVAPGDDGAPPLMRLGSFFQVPILADGNAVGLLFVGAEAEHQFTEEHIRLLYTVANQASAALQRMQAFLETERRRLRTVVEHLPEGVILLDSAQRITAANPVGRKLLESLTTVRVGEVLAHLGDHPFAEVIEKSPRDFVVERPARRVLEATVVRLEEDGAEPWLLVLRDVTEVREAIRRRDHFLAMLSHELRNPLAALTSAAQLFRLDRADAAVRERATNILSRQLRHIARLVDDLIDVSRFLHGKIQLHQEPTDFAELTARTVEAHRPLFEEEGKELIPHLAERPLMVHGDSVRLTQILDNLLSNARRFTPRGGRTEVSCRAEAEGIILRVCDTGLGIAADKFAEIFEPFMQVQDSLDRSQGGLGLGLALVKALTEMHGGSVRVASEGTNCGSEFTICLPPLLAPPAQTEANEATDASKPKPRRILLVEDEADVREMLQTYLQLCGHEVYTAANGPEGLAAFRWHEPEIAFIDIGLPGMDGYQLARALRLESHGTKARLIALSGYTRSEDRRRALDAGFDLHLAKPVHLEELEKMLTQPKK